MKKKLLLFLIIQSMFSLGLSSVFGQSPWVEVPSAPNFYAGGGFFQGKTIFSSAQPNIIWGLFTANSGQGRGSARAFTTLDNGQNWQVQEVAGTQAGHPNTGSLVVDMFVLDSQNAWLLRRDVSNNALILSRTTTGISGLVSLPNPLPAAFTSIHFFTATVGIAVAKSPWAVYRTTDGGSTWGIVTTPPITNTATDDVTGKQSLSNSLWITTSSGTMLRTTDAGLTWTTTPDVIGKVAFEDQLNGLAYNTPVPRSQQQPQQLQRTTDGGLTWATVSFSGQPIFRTMTAVPGSSGTYISGGYLVSYNFTTDFIGVTAITRDRGTSWQLLATDTTPYESIVATSATQVWANPLYNYGGGGGPPSGQKMILHYAGTALAIRRVTAPEQQIWAYPNPTTGVVQLAGPLQGSEIVRVYDAAGKLCQQTEVSNSKRVVDLSTQSPGLYQVLLTAVNGTVRSQRISKAP